MLVRAQEMARYVETGTLDAGITGRDWVLETAADVTEMAELPYAKQSMAPVRWVLAVPEEAPVQSARDLEGKVIATEVVHITQKYLERHGVTGARGVFLGSDRSEGAATCGRDCGGHGDGFVAARESVAHRGYRAGVAHVFIAHQAAAADPWAQREDRAISCCCSKARSPRTTRSASCSTCAAKIWKRCCRRCRR